MQQIVKTLNRFFETADLYDPIKVAIIKFKNHPSILAIKSRIIVLLICSETNDILEIIDILKSKKMNCVWNIPTICLWEIWSICAPTLKCIWNNEMVSQQQLSVDLKIENVKTAFNNENSTLTSNYRPANVKGIFKGIWNSFSREHFLFNWQISFILFEQIW